MKKLLTIVTAVLMASILFSSCSTLNTTLKEPNVRVELIKNDFALSQQLSAEATTTKIIVSIGQIILKKTVPSKAVRQK